MAETLHESFLEDIIANPADDAPRLIYADWLDDQGDSDRAEFIRGQIALATLSPNDPAHGPLETRSRELLTRHHHPWSLEVAKRVRQCTFRRGFIAEVSLDGVSLLDNGADLLTLAPIEAIHLEANAAQLVRLLELSVFQRVNRLELRGGELGDQGVERLIHSPHVGQFEYLILHHCGLSSRSAELLVQLDLSRLTQLNLGANDLRDEGVERLVTSPDLTQLRYLGLGGNELNAGTARTLARATNLGSLVKLNLGANYLGDAEIALLAGASHLVNLRELDLRYNEFGQDGALALVDSPYLGNLTRLDVTENALGPVGTGRLRERFGAALIS